MTSHVIAHPSALSTLTSAPPLSPILLRLLECPVSLLPRLSTESFAALADLPAEDRPTSYEGLLDVARFCVEEDPGWSDEERAKLIGGHPRIGRSTGKISKESEKEQGKTGKDAEETLNRLDRLNFLYERRFPTLRFVTYVAGRPRPIIADELEALLGPEIVQSAPVDAKYEPDNVAESWKGFPKSSIAGIGSAEWIAELRRGEDALWEIAGDRAAKLLKEVESGTVSVEIATSNTTPGDDTNEVDSQLAGAASGPALTITAEGADDSAAFDVPFLSQATFRALIFASPILHNFFENDLPTSFLLQPVEKTTSSKDAFLSAFNDATIQGGKAVTRERVKGLLGGLFGEVADAVGSRFQQQTISGPKPSFNRRNPGLSLEEATRTQTGKLAPVSPAALSSHRMTTTASATSANDEISAAETLRQAQEALMNQRDSANQFVIDAPGDADETGAFHDEEEDDLDMGGLEGEGEQGRLVGKEAQMAKGECERLCKRLMEEG